MGLGTVGFTRLRIALMVVRRILYRGILTEWTGRCLFLRVSRRKLQAPVVVKSLLAAAEGERCSHIGSLTQGDFTRGIITP